MKKNPSDHTLAPEQYELHARPIYQFGINRRTFFHVLGSGIAVAVSFSRSVASDLIDPSGPEDQLATWIHRGK